MQELHLLPFILLQLLLTHAWGQSCNNTKAVFGTIFDDTSSPSGIYTSLTQQAGSICQLEGTCCSSSVESMFQESAVNNYRMQFIEMLTSRLSGCRNPSIFNKTANFMLKNKEVLKQDLLIGGFIVSDQYDHVFDTFFDYLASAVHTGNLEELHDKYFGMFFEMLLVVYVEESGGTYYPSTEESRQCFYSYFRDNLEGRLQRSLEIFQERYGLLMRYLRALRAADQVIDDVLEYRLTEECKISLMKMTHCANCAGYPNSLESCTGLCLNIVRGCLVDLVDLVEPMKSFSEVLVVFKDKIKRVVPYNQLFLLDQEILRVFSDLSSNGRYIVTNINLKCPTNSANQRRKRESSDSFVLVQNNVPYDAIDESPRCLLENIEVFNISLPDSMCDGGENETTMNDDECWNGKLYGSYDRSVLPYTRLAQKDNPEMVICQRSQFRKDISLLRYITKEMATLIGQCSPDDEDCIEVKDTDVYYDFTSIFDTATSSTPAPNNDDEEEEGVSGSGSIENEEMCRIEPKTTPMPIEATPTGNSPMPTTPEQPKTTDDGGGGDGNSTDSGVIVAQSGSSRLSFGISHILSIGLTVFLLVTHYPWCCC